VDWYEVIAKDGDKVVFQDFVRSKKKKTAIANVLTNKLKGDCTSVEAYEVEIIRKIEKVGENNANHTFVPAPVGEEESSPKCS
jgi:hypothetical protein